MKRVLMGAAALTMAAGMSHAASYNYDFLAEANKSGNIGEAIFDTFNTSTNSVFGGPNLKITASNGDNSAFVYFDNGNAGMGVCNEVGSSLNTYNPDDGTNRCKDASDDGLTTTGESLHFMATEQAVRITSISINSNHDGASILDTVWNIGGSIFDLDDFDISGVNKDAGNAQGDIKIALNIVLNVDETLSLFGTKGPNSYISAISLEAVPVPAAGLLLIAGLGSLAAMRKRKSQ